VVVKSGSIGSADQGRGFQAASPFALPGLGIYPICSKTSQVKRPEGALLSNEPALEIIAPPRPELQPARCKMCESSVNNFHGLFLDKPRLTAHSAMYEQPAIPESENTWYFLRALRPFLRESPCRDRRRTPNFQRVAGTDLGIK